MSINPAGHNPTDPEVVFGSVDAQKLRSSLTLFNEVEPVPRFTATLDRWFAGQPDFRTIALVNVSS